MPDSSRDTAHLAPVPPMPPGFDELPAEEKLFIYGNKDKPEMMAVYQATKIVQVHDKISKHDTRILSLEESRKHAKWWGSGVLTILLLLKAYIIGKITKILP